MFERQVDLQEPFRQSGINALGQLQSAQTRLPPAFRAQTGLPSAFTGEVDLQADPGYQFRLSEGLKALDRQAAARGGLISGAALKASQIYGQDMASQEYGQAYGRALTEYGLDQELNQLAYGRELDAYNALVGRSDTMYNRFAGQAGIGQTATNRLGSAAEQTGTNLANIIGQGATAQAGAIGAAGQARASGYMGQANALNATLGNITNIAGQYMASRSASPYGFSGSPSIYGSGPITQSTNYFGE
jgi:hypothetical protein